MTIDLLAQPTWDHLDARLRDAVARNPSNAPLVDVIRAPLTTLQLLWRDAIPTLSGDALAAERLRVTLQAASDAAALVAVADAALAQDKNGGEHHPGLVHLRTLRILAIAAFRVQPPVQAVFSVNVIRGLALQCGPAELLARLEPYGAPPDAYDNLLRLSVPGIVAAGVATRVFLRSHALDPVERARWRCIKEVLDIFTPQMSNIAGSTPSSMPPLALISVAAWSIAFADGIESVSRVDDLVAIEGSFEWTDRLAVVGVTGQNSVEIGGVKKVSTPEEGKTRLDVLFGNDVLWVGFVDRDRVKTVNVRRRGIRTLLAADPAIKCVVGEPTFDPEEILPDLPDTWPIAEAPPRTRTNQLPAGRPPARSDDDVPDPDRISVVALRVACVEGPPPVSQDEVEKILQAIGHRYGVALEQVSLPWVEDAAAVVSSPPTGDDDPRVAGLLEALARGAARTPGLETALWIAIVPGTTHLSVASEADAALGVGVATIPGLGACIGDMLDATSRGAVAAASSPSYRATGRLMVPSYRSVERPSIAARMRAPASRLRLIGRLAGTALELLEPPREEEGRAAGPGAPLETNILAVTLDRSGAELGRSPIRGHRATMPATFAALIPISPEVDRVELRRGHLVLARIERCLEKPTAATLDLSESNGGVTASWTVPSSARPVALTVEVSDRFEGDDHWVPLTELHTCAEQARLPLWRLDGARPARRVRLVACDGWNATASDSVFVPEEATFGPCAIRRVNDRTLWAELPGQSAATWFTLVRHTESGRKLDLAGAGGGEIRLSTDTGEVALVDTLELEHRDVYRRA